MHTQIHAAKASYSSADNGNNLDRNYRISLTLRLEKQRRRRDEYGQLRYRSELFARVREILRDTSVSTELSDYGL